MNKIELNIVIDLFFHYIWIKLTDHVISVLNFYCDENDHMEFNFDP